MPKKTNKKTS